MWWADIRLAEHIPAGLVTAREHEQVGRFRRAEDRTRAMLSRVLTRVVLARCASVEPSDLVVVRRCHRCGGPHGKPRLAGPGVELHFSVSHAGEVVGLAVTRLGAVGIDVEPLDGTRAGAWLDDAVLSPAEREALHGLSPTERTRARVLLWTRKEALLKATGHGLTVNPAHLRVSPPDRPAALVAWHHEPSRPTAATLRDLDPGPRHVASLAILVADACTVVERSAESLLLDYARSSAAAP